MIHVFLFRLKRLDFLLTINLSVIPLLTLSRGDFLEVCFHSVFLRAKDYKSCGQLPLLWLPDFWARGDGTVGHINEAARIRQFSDKCPMQCEQSLRLFMN